MTNRMWRNVGAVLLFIGIAGALGVWFPKSTAVATPTETSLSFGGTSEHNTPAFHLNGGSYVVSWTASNADNQPNGCYHAAYLAAPDGGARLPITGRLIPGNASDSTTLYGVPAGEHYVEIISSCTWRVTVTPR
jgi:hypothetical protein